MHAAEDDRAARSALRGELAELVAIAAEVGEPDHLVLLVMVAEDQELIAHLRLDGADSLLELHVRQGAERLEGEGSRAGPGRCRGGT